MNGGAVPSRRPEKQGWQRTGWGHPASKGRISTRQPQIIIFMILCWRFSRRDMKI